MNAMVCLLEDCLIDFHVLWLLPIHTSIDYINITFFKY